MKNPKGFVQNRGKPERFMEEGYIVYELLYHANENYNKQIDDKLGGVV
jgi:hypothetical protein